MPFKKGDPNINRNGRPKGTYGLSITRLVREALEEVEPKSGQKWSDLIIKRILLKAVNDGDQAMLKAIWNYIDGMPKQAHEVTGKDGKDLIPEPIYGGKSTV